MRKLQDLVRVNRDAGSEWGASVPDLPGCVATGRTLDVVMRRIQAAVQLHVCGLREDGDLVPRPRHRVVRPTRSAKQVEFYATVELAA